MAWGLIGAAAISAGGAYLASKKQSKAIEKASGTQAGIQEMQLGLYRDLLAEGKPLREALIQSGLSVLPGLTEYASGEPGTGPLFETALEKGTSALFRDLAPYGLTDSTVSGEALGTLGENLLSSDITRRLDVGQSLLGLQPQNTEEAIGLFGPMGVTGANISNLQLGQGMVRAGLYGNLTDIGSSLVQSEEFKNLFGGGTSGTLSGYGSGQPPSGSALFA